MRFATTIIVLILISISNHIHAQAQPYPTGQIMGLRAIENRPPQIVIGVDYFYDPAYGNEVFVCAMPLLGGTYAPQAGCRPVRAPRSGYGSVEIIIPPMGDYHFNGVEISLYTRQQTITKTSFSMQYKEVWSGLGKGEGDTSPPSYELIFTPFFR